MGLQKPNNTYWNVREFTIVKEAKYCHFMLACWDTKADRDKNEEPRHLSSLAILDGDFIFDWNQNVISQLYDKVKLLPEWQEAEDILEKK